jgi:predicted lipid carrier protein YhbT
LGGKGGQRLGLSRAGDIEVEVEVKFRKKLWGRKGEIREERWVVLEHEVLWSMELM